jgi:hypothetical protein
MVLDLPATIPRFVEAEIAEAIGVDVYPWDGSTRSNLTEVVDYWAPLAADLAGRPDRTNICVPQATGRASRGRHCH